MTVRLAETLGGLSLSGDIANNLPEGKVLRTALLAAELGRGAGFDAATVRDAYYAAIVRFMGCTGYAHEEASRYGAGDDVALRHTMAFADEGQKLRTLGRIVAGIAPGAPLWDRATAIARLVGDGRAVLEHARAQCDASLHLTRTFGLEPGVGNAVAAYALRWDGKGGRKGEGSGEGIPAAARLADAADVLELALARGGMPLARAELKRRRGGQLDPRLAAIAEAELTRLIEAAGSSDLWERFLAAEPEPHLTASPERIDEIAAALGRVADLKSVFTLGHSRRVADRAVVLAGRLGLDAAATAALERAALVHDIGRIGTPGRIWDKPGPLSRLEREQVELHPLATERILRRASALAALAPLAAAAYERLDGSGYHRRLAGSALDLPMRILAVADVATALAEERPFRAPFTAAEAAAHLRAEAKAGRLDGDVVAAHLDGGAAPRPAPVHPLSDRELEVLRWVARGKTNPEIGIMLGISAKTVQHHVAHVYEKIGVSSRAGAALYAMERRLLDPVS